MSTVHGDQAYSLVGDFLVLIFVIALIAWTVVNYLRSRNL